MLCGCCGSRWPCFRLQRAEDDVWGSKARKTRARAEISSETNEFKCNLKLVNWWINPAVESEGAGEEDSKTGNRSLQSVLINLPGTDFHSRERANTSHYVCGPEAKVTCQVHICWYCIFLQESWHPFSIVYSYVWCLWIRVESSVLSAE